MKLKQIIQTCDACPSQWEAYTEDDRPVYIRYRWGRLSVRVGKKDEDIVEAVESKEIYSKNIGDDLDGFIEWDKVWEKIKDLEI